MGRVNRYVMNDLGGGQRILKLAWVINFQKLTTIPLLGLGWLNSLTPAGCVPESRSPMRGERCDPENGGDIQ